MHQSKTVAINRAKIAFIRNKKQTIYLMMGAPYFFSTETRYKNLVPLRS